MKISLYDNLFALAMEQKQLTSKIFYGFEVTSEINMYLKENILWKNAQVEKPQGGFCRIRYQGKDYVGAYHGHTLVALQQIRNMESQLREKLAFFCPKVNCDNKPIFIFAQTFVS